MGLFDLLKPKQKGVQETRSALDAADDGTADDGVVGGLVTRILAMGLDGVGPLDSARAVADEALRESGGDVDKAVRKVARMHLVGGAVGGFATGLGGFVTMPVALPVNVLEFYVQAARMVGAVAALRGYDISDPRIRTAIALTLVGSDADEILNRAGLSTGAGRLTTTALRGLPPTAMLMVNKAVGFRLIKGVGTKAFARFGRGVPVAGGVVGGAIDGWMMKKIGDAALKEFPPRAAGSVAGGA